MWAAATAWIVRALGATPADTPAAAAAVTSAAVAQGDGDPNVILYLLGGGSAVTIIGMIGKGITSVVTGRAAAETRRSMGLVEQRDKAWEERDEERAKREAHEVEARARIERAEVEARARIERVEVEARARIEHAEDDARRRVERAERNLRRVMDHAGTLQYLCRLHGVPAEEVPKYPKLERDPDDDPPLTSGPTPAVS